MAEGRVKAEAARELGLAEQTLHNWIKKYEESQEEGFVGSGNLRPENEESYRLNKRIRDLEEENAILKKAMGIFAQKT